MNELLISIINVTIETIPTQRASYQKAEVTYKNKSYQDKVESKKIMSFAEPKAFDALKNAQFGDEFYITRIKDDKGYWKWNHASREQPQEQVEQMQQPQQAKQQVAANPAPKSNYETAEERANRQVLIVRQSSIANAVAALKTDKAKLSAEDVVDMAKQFEQYVMTGTLDVFAGLEDDVPL